MLTSKLKNTSIFTLVVNTFQTSTAAPYFSSFTSYLICIFTLHLLSILFLLKLFLTTSIQSNCCRRRRRRSHPKHVMSAKREMSTLCTMMLRMIMIMMMMMMFIIIKKKTCTQTQTHIIEPNMKLLFCHLCASLCKQMATISKEE